MPRKADWEFCVQAVDGEKPREIRARVELVEVKWEALQQSQLCTIFR